jgi:hypothetical protein
MFEHRSKPLLPADRFLVRQARFVVMAFGMVLVSLALGVAGYMGLAGMGLVDALYNASMILGGMGPVDALTTDGAKLFASAYALYSGIALLGTVAVILTPMVHRMLHALHMAEEE